MYSRYKKVKKKNVDTNWKVLKGLLVNGQVSKWRTSCELAVTWPTHVHDDYEVHETVECHICRFKVQLISPTFLFLEGY